MGREIKCSCKSPVEGPKVWGPVKTSPNEAFLATLLELARNKSKDIKTFGLYGFDADCLWSGFGLRALITLLLKETDIKIRSR